MSSRHAESIEYAGDLWSLSPQEARQVDQICGAFEKHQRFKRRPRLEEWLVNLAEPVRSVVFRELLQLELESLRPGQRADEEEYRRRFPRYAEIIRNVFRDISRAEWDEPPQIDLVVPDYLILERLGEGGMGAVYKAIHTRLHRIQVLKVIRDEVWNNDDARARFQQEMANQGALRHENIVQVQGTHEDAWRRSQEQAKVPYLVMDYIDGLDLWRLVQRWGPLPVPEACEIARRAALGLQHVHEWQLVHRDVKPSNLLLGRDQDDRVQVKLADLGLAKQWGYADSRSGQAHSVVGTPAYIAPEQARDPAKADIRADVYSLGITLFTLLAGRPPYAGHRFPTHAALIEAQQSVPLPDIPRRPDVPPALRVLIARMAAKNPNDRFGEPAEVALALSPFCAGHDLRRLLEEAEQLPDRSLPDDEIVLEGTDAFPDRRPLRPQQHPSLAGPHEPAHQPKPGSQGSARPDSVGQAAGAAPVDWPQRLSAAWSPWLLTALLTAAAAALAFLAGWLAHG